VHFSVAKIKNKFINFKKMVYIFAYGCMADNAATGRLRRVGWLWRRLQTIGLAIVVRSSLQSAPMTPETASTI